MNGSSAASERWLRALAAYRWFAGVGVWVAPRVFGRAFFAMPTLRTPIFPYVSRLAGVREAALAAGATRSSRDARTLWLRLGLICDAVDTLAALIGSPAGLSRRQTVSLAAATAVSTILSVAALVEHTSSPRDQG